MKDLKDVPQRWDEVLGHQGLLGISPSCRKGRGGSMVEEETLESEAKVVEQGYSRQRS